MKLLVASLVLCTTLFVLGMGPGMGTAQAYTTVGISIWDTSGHAIVGAPVIVNGGATQYTNTAGVVEVYPNCPCDGCLWMPEISVQVYRKMYTLDTSSVICSMVHYPYFGYNIVHTPNPKPCIDCPNYEDPMPSTVNPGDEDPGTPETMSWSSMKARY